MNTVVQTHSFDKLLLSFGDKQGANGVGLFLALQKWTTYDMHMLIVWVEYYFITLYNMA